MPFPPRPIAEVQLRGAAGTTQTVAPSNCFGGDFRPSDLRQHEALAIVEIHPGEVEAVRGVAHLGLVTLRISTSISPDCSADSRSGGSGDPADLAASPNTAAAMARQRSFRAPGIRPGCPAPTEAGRTGRGAADQAGPAASPPTASARRSAVRPGRGGNQGCGKRRGQRRGDQGLRHAGTPGLGGDDAGPGFPGTGRPGFSGRRLRPTGRSHTCHPCTAS